MDLLSISRITASADRINVNLGGDTWVRFMKSILPTFERMPHEVWMSAQADSNGQYIEFESDESWRIELDVLLKHGEAFDPGTMSDSESAMATKSLKSSFGDGIAAV